MLNALLSAAVWLNVAKAPAPRALAGRVVVVHVWRAEDPGERDALQALKSLEQTYRAGVAVLGVGEAAGSGLLREAVLREELDYPVALDARGRLAAALGARPGELLVFPPEGGEPRRVDRASGLPAEVARLEPAPGIARAPLAVEPAWDSAPRHALAYPQGLAVDRAAGLVYVADTGHDRIVVLDRKGATREVIGAGRRGYADGPYATALFDRPRAVALLSGALIVTEAEQGRLRFVDLSRRRVLTVNSPLLPLPTSAAAAEGRLFFAEPPLRELAVLDRATVNVSPYAGSGREVLKDGALPAAGFPDPTTLACDGATLFVGDSSTPALRAVALASPDVRTLSARLPGSPSALAASSGTLFAALPDGRLYALERGSGAPRLLASGLDDPQAMAVDGPQVLIAEAGAGRLARFSLKGRRLPDLSPRALPPVPAAPPVPVSPQRRVLPEQQVSLRSGSQDSLQVSVLLPPGWRLHPNAPFRYRVAEAAGPIRFEESTRKGMLIRPRFPIEIHFSTPPGKDQLALELDYSYCPEKGPGVCRTDSARLTVDVDAGTSGPTSDGVSVTAP